MSEDIKLNKAKIAILYKNGLNLRQIGEHFGVSNAFICRFIIENDIFALELKKTKPRKKKVIKDE